MGTNSPRPARLSLDVMVEAAARAQHDLYLTQLSPKARETLQTKPWDELPEWHRDDSRARAAVGLIAALDALSTEGWEVRRDNPSTGEGTE